MSQILLKLAYGATELLQDEFASATGGVTGLDTTNTRGPEVIQEHKIEATGIN